MSDQTQPIDPTTIPEEQDSGHGNPPPKDPPKNPTTPPTTSSTTGDAA